MFSAWCSSERRHILLSEQRITHLAAHGDRTEVRFRCWCGVEGSVTVPRLRARRCRL